MKKTIHIWQLLACLPLLLAVGSAGAIDIERGVSSIEASRFAYSLYGFSILEYEHEIPPRPSKEELVGLLGQIDSRLERDEADPVLWFLKGAVTRRLVRERGEEIDRLGMSKEEYFNDATRIKLLGEAITAYRKAIEVDGREDASRHLDTRMLDVISGDMFSDGSLRVPALRRQLERWKTDEDFHKGADGGLFDFEFNTYGNIVRAYVDEKRYDEALREVNEMQKRFGSNERWSKEIAAAQERITRDKAAWEREQEMKAEQERQKPTAPSSDPAAQPTDSGAPQPTNTGSSKWPSPLVLLLAVAIGVVGIVFLWWRRRR